MTKPQTHIEAETEARRGAAEEPSPTASAPAAPSLAMTVETLRLVYDLHIHQLELELQNQVLLKMRTHLEQSLERYANLYDFAPMGYFTLAASGLIQEVNLAGATLLGQDRPHLLNQCFENFLAAATRPAFNALFAAALAGSSKTYGAVTLAVEGLPPRHLHLECMREATATDPQCLLAAIDITERARVEAELQFQAAVLNQIQDQVTVTDLQGVVTYVNDAVCRILKLPREQIIGRSVECYGDDPSLGASQRQIIDWTLAYGEWRGQVVNQAADGTRIILDCRTRLVRNSQGQPTALCGISTDITARKQVEERLQRSEEHYRAVIETSPDGFWIMDGQGRLLEANETYARLSGYRRDELRLMSVFDLDESERPVTAARLEQIAWNGSDLFQTRHRAKSGRLWAAEVNVMYWPIAGGQFFVFIRDLHRRQRSEALLKVRMHLSEIARTGTMDELLQAALDATERFTSSEIGFFHFVAADQEHVTLQAWSAHTLNTACEAESTVRHFPVSQAGVWVDCIRQRRPIIHNDYPHLPHRKTLPEGHPPLIRELTVPILRNDRVVAVLGVGNKPEDYTDDDVDAVQHLMSLLFDAVERKQAEERIEHLAYYDALTQLPNRVLLTDRLQQAMAQTLRDQNRLVVCYLDLDEFKPINDRYGHAIGDQVLVEVAQRLKGCVRAGDTVARLGGDEFVLLLGDLANIEESENALDRVISALQIPFTAAGQPMPLTASLGVTLYPDDDSDPDTLLRHTDQAMYAAKQAGGHRYHWFDADYDRHARTYRERLCRIEAGLAAGEFCLYYQPKVDMRQGTVIGAEALIRWQHPEQGLLAPAQFIPAVETSDLAVTVGHWVMQEALRQMTAWAAQGLHLPVSVNISSRHLQKPEFIAEVQTLLAAYPDVPPAQLELEILETVALGDLAAISRLIEGCRQLGVRFALDDFGTGYSSLTYLKNLAVHLLKIDQSFVRDLLVDSEARAIVEGVIGLSVAFHRQVIAEGVETDAHGRLLLQLGCDLAQGYGIARPMPPEHIPTWIDGWSAPDAWTGDLAASE